MQSLPSPAGDVVCLNCGDANDSDADFCARCGAPVGRFTTLDPFKAIYTEGWLFRKSVSARIRPIVLIGMWVLFGIPLGGVAVFVWLRPAVAHPMGFLYTLGLCAIYLLVLVRVTRNFIRNHPGPGPRDPDE